MNETFLGPEQRKPNLSYRIRNLLLTGIKTSIQIAEELEVDPQQVKNALTKLSKRREIVEVDKIGRFIVWSIRKDLAYHKQKRIDYLERDIETYKQNELHYQYIGKRCMARQLILYDIITLKMNLKPGMELKNYEKELIKNLGDLQEHFARDNIINFPLKDLDLALIYFIKQRLDPQKD